MKQNSRSVTFEISEASSVCFDQLNHAIEAFYSRVINVKPGVVEKSIQMSTQHLHHLLNWLELTSHGVVRPLSRESVCNIHRVVGLKLYEILFDRPRSSRLQIHLMQRSELNRLTRPPRLCVRRKRRLPLWITKSRNGLSVHS